MKIRRKLPAPPRSGRPAYLIGYTSTPPTLPDVQACFDLDYGGPLTLRQVNRASVPGEVPLGPVVATHGPWSATVQLSLSPDASNIWKDSLGWGHTLCGQVSPASLGPRDASNQVLHVARLARVLTLLTEGTAYDTITQTYLNPSDWKDRPLDRFTVRDHVTIEQADGPDPEREWFSTRGLVKFGLDEVETYRPVGLPSRPTIEVLLDLTEQLIRIGHAPKVGSTVIVPVQDLSVRIIRHRTAAPTGIMVGFREIAWEPLN